MSALAVQEDAAANANCAACERRWVLPAILLAAALVRGAVLVVWGANLPLHIADEQDYHSIAVNLLERQEFAIHQDQPSSARPPLFPALLSGIYAVFGTGNLIAVRIAQLVCGLLIVWQTYLLGRRLFDRRTGLWAALFAAFYPSLIGYTTFVLSELLFTALLLAALLSLQRWWQSGSFSWLSGAGLWLGFATLARSVLWPSWPLWGVFVFLTERGMWGRKAAAALVMLASFAAPIAPWAWRNYQLEKTLIVVDTLGGRNMMMGNYEHTLEYRAWDTVLIDGEKSWDIILLRKHPDYGALTQGQRDKLAMRYGIDYVLDHPATFVRRSLIKFVNFWQLEREIIAGLADGRWGQYSAPLLWALAAIIFGGYAFCLLTGIMGFLTLPSENRRLHWLLLLIVAFICAVHTVVFAHSRYHLSLMPLFFPYAAAACLRWRDAWEARRSGSFALALAVCAFLVASWSWQALFVDGERIRAWI